MFRSLVQRVLRTATTKSLVCIPCRHPHQQIFELPARLAEREIFLLKYGCVSCKGENEEILLAAMFQSNLVMVNCSHCAARYCMADQLEWYQEIATQNPALIQELEKEGKIAPGLIVADFETQIRESLDKQKLMKLDDATNFVAVAYNDDTAVAEAKVTLLLIQET